MSTWEIIDSAVEILEKENAEYAILQCTGNYPSNIQDSNIEVISTFKNIFNCPIGYSDHTMSEISSIMAIAKGAKIIEKQ